jgi:hypothetical protein
MRFKAIGNSITGYLCPFRNPGPNGNEQCIGYGCVMYVKENSGREVCGLNVVEAAAAIGHVFLQIDETARAERARLRVELKEESGNAMSAIARDIVDALTGNQAAAGSPS